MDVSTTPEKPSNVTTAVNVLYFSLGISLARVFLEWWFGSGSVKSVELAICVILVPLILWVYYMTGKGRNWARTTVLIMACATVPFAIPSIIETLNHTSLSTSLRVSLIVFDVVGVILAMAALVFLFQKDSADWFKAVNQQRCPITVIKGPEDERVSYAVEMREAERTGNDLSIRNAANETIAALRELTKNTFPLLRNTDQAMLSYVWRAWLIAFIPSLVLGAIATSAFASLGHKDPGPDYSSLMEFAIFGVLIAPWLETIIMWPILSILKRIFRKTLWAALACGALFGALHVAGGPHFSQGVATTWGFFVLSLCFLEWRKKSRGRAIIVTALVHTCTNGLVAGVALIAVLLGGDNPLVNKVSPSPPAQQKEASARAGTENLHPDRLPQQHRSRSARS